MKTYNCFPGGKFKALTMSYDDGVIDDERLVNIFNKYGIKGTFNINSGLSSSKKLPKERLKELYKGHVGDVAEMVRIALTSSKQSPNIYYVLRILKIDEIKSRIQKTIELIK